MELPKIMIKFTISDTATGNVIHTGKFNFTNEGERRNCSARFNQCLLDGYTVTTVRVPK